MNRTVVIIHPGALGDVLLAVPAIQQLKARFRNNRLVLCAKEAVARLLLECDEVHDWISLDRREIGQFFADPREVSGNLKDRLTRCDCVVGWMQDESGMLARGFQQVGIREIRIESPFSSRLLSRHQQDRFLETIDERSIASPLPSRLNLPQSQLDEGVACLQQHGLQTDLPLILIHVGSGSRHKCVTPVLLTSIINRIQSEGVSVALLEGPADHELVSRVCEPLPQRPAIIRGLDLSSVAGLIANSDVFIGHDSGITHLSALVRTRTVALFGPTDPDRWAPRGSHVTVLRGEPCLCPSWNEVSRCSNRSCLNLSVDEVVSTCMALCQKSATPRNLTGCTLSLPTSYARVAS